MFWIYIKIKNFYLSKDSIMIVKRMWLEKYRLVALNFTHILMTHNFVILLGLLDTDLCLTPYWNHHLDI